jgi:serine/threonine protein kinase
MTAEPPATTDLLRSMVKAAKVATRSLCLADRQLGFFRIEKLLGEGSYAEVYRAVDTRYGRPVALKVLRDPIEDVPPGWAPFEAAALARARHEAVVTVLDVYVIEGHACVALELLSEETLYTRLHGGYLDSTDVTSLGIELCAALAQLHARDVVHGDIKPLNIVFDSERRPRLVDFGTAQRTAENRAEGIGSPLYMAPEQGRKRSPASDVFNLALTLVEAIAGSSTVLTVRAHVENTAAVNTGKARQHVINSLTPFTTVDLAGALASALEHDPMRRVKAEEFYRRIKWCAAPQATLADTWTRFAGGAFYLLIGCFDYLVGVANHLQPSLTMALFFVGVPLLAGMIRFANAVATSLGRVVDGQALASHAAVVLPNRGRPPLANYLRTDRLQTHEWLKPDVSAEPDELLGRIADRFTLQRKLWLWEHRTGYLAWDTTLQRTVIAEVGPYIGHSADIVQGLETTPVRLALPLLYSSYTADDLQYDVYEALEGVFLSELLTQGHVDYMQALEIAERVAALLEQLGRNNRTIVMDSLVASTILVRPDGRLVFYAVARHTVPTPDDPKPCKPARLERSEEELTQLRQALTEVALRRVPNWLIRSRRQKPPASILASPIRLPDRVRQPANASHARALKTIEAQEALERRAISFGGILRLVEVLASHSPQPAHEDTDEQSARAPGATTT